MKMIQRFFDQNRPFLVRDTRVRDKAREVSRQSHVSRKLHAQFFSHGIPQMLMLCISLIVPNSKRNADETTFSYCVEHVTNRSGWTNSANFLVQFDKLVRLDRVIHPENGS